MSRPSRVELLECLWQELLDYQVRRLLRRLLNSPTP